MKKLLIGCVVTLMAASLVAAGGRKSAKKAVPTSASNEEEVTEGRGAKIKIVQEPQLGQSACLGAPSVAGGSNIGQCFKKPRLWVVLETKYETFGTDATAEKPASRFHDQLTFTWHVLLETKTASENKGNREKLAPYSYFTCTTTYFNIPAGMHAASVVLPPSYRERYGEPRAVGFEITNEKGEFLNGDSWSLVKGIAPHTKFWEDQKIMNATQNDEPMIERRQGLVDRSKTIWALVNPNDYESTVQ